MKAKTNTYKPSLFLGSSSEAAQLFNIITSKLKNKFNVTQWNKGFFQGGKMTLDHLINSISDYDYAIMLLTPDDKIQSRGKKYLIARDNVEFETGLFMSILGMSNVFIIEGFIDSVPSKKMSDIQGLTIFPLNIPTKNNLPNYDIATFPPNEIARICEDIINIVKERRNSFEIRNFKKANFETQKILSTMLQDCDLDFEIPVLKWRNDTERDKINNIKNGTWTILADSTFSYLRLVFRKILETLISGDEYYTVTNLKFWSDGTYNKLEFIAANQQARQKGVLIKRVMIIDENDLNDPSFKQQLSKVVIDFHKKQIADTLQFLVYQDNINSDAFSHVPFVTIKRVLSNKNEKYLTLFPTISDKLQPKIDVIFQQGHLHHKRCLDLFEHCSTADGVMNIKKMAVYLGVSLK